ncbi:Sporulation thiol-disulfide oxidoreductase A precursor [compost metagenome]
MRKLSNILFIGLAAFFIFQRAPSIIENFKKQGAPAPEFVVGQLDGSVFVSKDRTEKTLLVFWATWCGPCDLELARIQGMIDRNEIKASSVLAVSSYEDSELVRKVVFDRKYTFPVGLDLTGIMAAAFNVKGTPTVVLLDENKNIDWITVGASPSLEIRTKKFFKE